MLAIQINESDKERWEWIQSKTVSLADLGYTHLRRELDTVKKDVTELKEMFETVKKDLTEMKQTVLQSKLALMNGKLFSQQDQSKFVPCLRYHFCTTGIISLLNASNLCNWCTCT